MNTTIKNHRGRLSAVFSYALDRDMIEAAPIPKTKKRKKSALKVDWVTVPSETQMQRMLQEAKEDDYGVPEGDFKLYLLFLLAVATGAYRCLLVLITSKTRPKGKDPKEAATLVVADFWGLLVPMVIPENTSYKNYFICCTKGYYLIPLTRLTTI